MSDPKTKGTAQGEPSMEEILASIRRIISEDGDPAKAAAAPPPAPAAVAPPPAPEPTPAPSVPPAAAAPAPQDVLELTEIVDDPPALPPEPRPPQPASPVSSDDGLLSSSVVSAASGSLASLVSAKRQTERGLANNPLPLGDAGLTIEAIVREELRPILKAWLDHNLSAMVERMVQREIQRISRNVD